MVLFGAIPIACIAQTPEVLDWHGKLAFHAEQTYRPLAIAGIVAYAGFQQAINSPKEWGRSDAAYDERVASVAGWSAIHGTLAFGLDTTLHQDPRYYRLGESGFKRRVGHAIRGTILTRTDSGGETLATWRIGSAYGSAFLSNLWRPDRVDNVHLGIIQGSIGLGFDLIGNLGTEFWPDIKRSMFHHEARLGP